MVGRAYAKPEGSNSLVQWALSSHFFFPFSPGFRLEILDRHPMVLSCVWEYVYYWDADRFPLFSCIPTSFVFIFHSLTYWDSTADTWSVHPMCPSNVKSFRFIWGNPSAFTVFRSIMRFEGVQDFSYYFHRSKASHRLIMLFIQLIFWWNFVIVQLQEKMKNTLKIYILAYWNCYFRCN